MGTSLGVAGAAGTSSGASAPPAVPVSLPSDFLAQQFVDNDAPYRRVLYSWTTEEQYETLRTDRVLLTRTERPGVGGGLIRDVLRALAEAGDPLSQALQAPEFQAARYAWPNPWATLMGWPGESYGDWLIEIELRDDAWVMTLLGSQWQVVDRDDQLVARKDAIENPGRIGAIFHFHEADPNAQCGGSFSSGGAGAYREYFLPNESMIARWSLATDQMRARLEADIATLEAYREYKRQGAGTLWGAFENSTLCIWKGQHGWTEGAPDHAYLASLALTSPAYVPATAPLDALIEALSGALFDPDPLVVERE